MKMNSRRFLVLAFGFTASALRGAPIEIGTDLEVFWDDCLVDAARTTAGRRVHQPVYADVAFTHDRPWESDNNSYHNLVVDEDAKGRLFRMYYIAVDSSGTRVCYAESRDGISWIRPDLGLCEYAGSRQNNILLNVKAFGFPWDNFMVFKDANPACPADQRYKAVAVGAITFTEDGTAIKESELRSLFSTDGVHFTPGALITRKGAFDTLNCAFWDVRQRKYHLYVRGFHEVQNERNGDTNVRDIRYLESVDFKTWTDPKQLDFGEGEEDYALYTNIVHPYPRAPHIKVGFPTRYVERKAWTRNYDSLPSPDRRKDRMKCSARYALAITDCIFMMSRDGFHFHRENEAWMRPGPEYADNWVYGDAYPMRGFVESKAALGDDPELSFFATDGQWSGRPMRLLRHTQRMDGFVSRHADYEERLVVTRPLVFTGDRMRLNFSTSARGYVYVRIVGDAGQACESCELFGDKVDRIVAFDRGQVKDFANKPVTIEFRMRDADLYSFGFLK